MNLVFGNTKESIDYWNLYLKDDIKRNFIMVIKFNNKIEY